MCTSWLGSLADLVVPLGVLPWQVEAYTQQVVETLIDEWHVALHHGQRRTCTRALDLAVRMLVRGGSSLFAAELCAACLHKGEALEGPCTEVSWILLDIASLHPGAACALVDAILEAVVALICLEGGKLRAANRKALVLMEKLLSSELLDKENPVQHHLADRMWRRRRAASLPAATIFAIVDIMHSQPQWSATLTQWLQAWSEPSGLKAADLESERALALRLARGLATTGDGAMTDLHGADLHLLLQGVHLRLGAQVEESRSYGMAVAEIFARKWKHLADDPDQDLLHFDGFDINLPASGAFGVAGESFSAESVEAICWSAPRGLWKDNVEGKAAFLLCMP